MRLSTSSRPMPVCAPTRWSGVREGLWDRFKASRSISAPRVHSPPRREPQSAAQGYGQLKLGLLNEILGRYAAAPAIFGAAAPDTGNMEMLAALPELVRRGRMTGQRIFAK